MARSFAPSLSVLIPLLFLSLGSALQLGPSVGTMAHSVGQEDSPTLTYEYQVFVSFSEDTHKNFTCHLFVALDRKGIHVYKSGFIRTELMKAIEKSRIAVVVFSKNYGNSDWCLDELVKIMECKRLFNQRVIPIFYDVSPYDVRKLKGKAILNGSEDKVNSWRVALTNSANLAGLHLKPYRLESEFIEEIVENIWKIVNEESATAPSRPQIDVSGQHSGRNDISEWANFFISFLVLSKKKKKKNEESIYSILMANEILLNDDDVCQKVFEAPFYLEESIYSILMANGIHFEYNKKKFKTFQPDWQVNPIPRQQEVSLLSFIQARQVRGKCDGAWGSQIGSFPSFNNSSNNMYF